MKYLNLPLVFLLVVASDNVLARMYQWQDPDTGTTQLSGKPPSWYRSGQVGPRVFVFEKGKIIDDTDIVLSDEHRALMRERAYLQVDEDLAKAKQKAIEATQQRVEKSEDEQPTTDVVESDEQVIEDALVADEMIEDDYVPERTVKVEAEKLTMEDMKQLIQDWEKAQEDKAKQLIGN